jgi:hypothetical protein
MGSRVRLDAVEKRKISCPYRQSNPGSSLLLVTIPTEISWPLSASSLPSVCLVNILPHVDEMAKCCNCSNVMKLSVAHFAFTHFLIIDLNLLHAASPYFFSAAFF